MADIRTGAILAADFGSVNTRVMLFDLVDGEYRLVARGDGRTTLGYPLDDVSVGFDRILQTITESTGRQFYNPAGELITPETPNRSGVDYLLTTASAGRPVRAVLIGLVPHISIASSLRAVSGAYVEPVATISLEDDRDEEERLNAILLSRPDLIFIAGGTEKGATSAIMELVDIAALAVRLMPAPQRPTVLYAGNSQLVEPVQSAFGETTTLFIAHNVRPSMEDEQTEAAQIELGKAYDSAKEKRGEAYARIANMSSSGVLPTAQSYGVVTEYLAQLHECNVLSVDVGSAVSILASHVNGFDDISIRTDLGMGHSAHTLLDTVSAEVIADYLPFYVRPAEIDNYALNKGLRPATVPMSRRDLYLEQAFLRASIRHLLGEARTRWVDHDSYDLMPPVGLILASGAPLANTGVPGLTTLLLLDALQPTGIVDIKADSYGLLPALGAMALFNPTAVVQILDGDPLEHLGTVINVSGNPKFDTTALKLKIKTEDGEQFEHEVKGGHLWMLPLPDDHSLEVEIRAGRGLSIGSKNKIKQTFRGGTAGLIFDARGRKLDYGSTPEVRAEHMPMWLAEITGTEPEAIPAEWLEKLDDIVMEMPEDVSSEDDKPKDQQAILDERISTMETAAVSIAGDDDFLADVDDDEDPFSDMGALRDILND